jgi:hypothetical protein
MQTMTVQIQDNYVSDSTIEKDENLKLDPYFYERKEELHQIRDDVKNGNMILLSQEESDNEIEMFFKELENN